MVKLKLAELVISASPCLCLFQMPPLLSYIREEFVHRIASIRENCSQYLKKEKNVLWGFLVVFQISKNFSSGRLSKICFKKEK